MDTPEGLSKPRRAIPTLGIAVVVLAMIVVIGFAVSHLLAKGGSPQAEATPAQTATGSAPPTREPYGPNDYTEPKGK